MLERCSALRGVVDAERRRACVRPGEIRHQRIVRVDDEKRLFGKGRDHRPPALGDQLQLPVAVELVAKEIAETHDARPDGGGQVGQRRLVDLEQAQLGIACVDEGRRDSRGKVRAGGVVGQPEAGSEDRRRHRGARRLAVGRGQDHAPFGQTLRKPRDRPRVDCGQQLPRQRRSAALPREARQVTRRARKARLHREPHERECRSLQRVISSTIPRRRDDLEAIRAERVVGGSDNCNGVACAPGQCPGGRFSRWPWRPPPRWSSRPSRELHPRASGLDSSLSRWSGCRRTRSLPVQTAPVPVMAQQSSSCRREQSCCHSIFLSRWHSSSRCRAGSRGRAPRVSPAHSSWRPRLRPRRWHGSPPPPPWRWRRCSSTGKPPGRSQAWSPAQRSWRPTSFLSSSVEDSRAACRAAPPLSLGTELLLAALGAALAAVCLTNPWLAPFAVAPLLLLRRWFEIPLLEHQARRDAKTGLFNAQYFELAVDRELAEARAVQRPMSVLLADLDLLRDINNAYGHLAGDAVLRGVGGVLLEQASHPRRSRPLRRGRVRGAASEDESRRRTGDRRTPAHRRGGCPLPEWDCRDRAAGDRLHRRRVVSGARHARRPAPPPCRRRRVPREGAGAEPRPDGDARPSFLVLA